MTVDYNDVTYSTSLSETYSDSSIGKYGFVIISGFPEAKYSVTVKCHLTCEGFSPLTFSVQTRIGDDGGFDTLYLYPSTIEGQILRIRNAKNNICQAIIKLGGVSYDESIDTYANVIDTYADAISILEGLFNVCNYNYNAVADDAGLKEIGWDYVDIGYFKYNNLHLKSENVENAYKVSDGNKAIKITDKSGISQYIYNTDFKYCPKFNTSDVTDMSSMFKSCSSLITVPLFDTSKVTTMNSMLSGCSSFISVPLFDTSKVTNMGYMFYNCKKLISVPKFNTSNVKYMNGTFSGCSSLVSIPKLNAYNLTNAGEILSGCSSLTTLGGFTGLKINLSLITCTKLTKESILNVFNEAADVTSSPKTLTLGSTNLNKLTDTEKAIATKKGWTLK